MSQPPTQLSTLAGSAVAGTRRNLTTLWSAFAKQIPMIRNATHYYAHDAQRIGRDLYEKAQTLTAASAEYGSDVSSSGDATDTEAHYVPLAQSDLGVSVKRVRLHKVEGSGDTFLSLCVEGGFAIFVVSGTLGVIEVAVELQARESAAVVDVLMIKPTVAVAVFTDAVAWYDVTTKSFAGKTDLPDAASSAQLLRNHIAVASAEYSQIAVLSMDPVNSSFTVRSHIVADRPVFATRHRWIAYCGSPSNNSKGVLTEFSANAQETAAENVTKTIKGGLAKVQGFISAAASSMTGAAVDQLGIVTVTDVETGRDFASFVAHHHNLQHMAFDATGTMLATASVVGTNVCVWHITPSRNGAGSVVVLLARLSRGITANVITGIDFAPLNHFVAVSTSVGTCHMYQMPPAQINRIGVDTPAAYAAPVLTAASRCRCAPMSASVDPAVSFEPWLGQRPLRTRLVVATNAATVAVFDIHAHGVSTAHTQHLTEFSAAQDTASGRGDGASPVDGGAAETGTAAAQSTSCSTTLSHGDNAAETADLAWRELIELRTHPARFKFRGMRVLDAAELDKAMTDAAPHADGGDGEVASVDADWNEA